MASASSAFPVADRSGTEPSSIVLHHLIVDGRKAAYSEVGADHENVLVFLHGWLLGQRAYHSALRHLSKFGYRVIAPEMPGFGGTADLVSPNPTFEDYANWILAFLEALDLKANVTLVGHSFGGAVGIATANADSRRIKSLVLISPVGGGEWESAKDELHPSKPMSARPLWNWGLSLHVDTWDPAHFARVVPRVLSDAVPNMLRHPNAAARTAQLARKADLRSELAQIIELKVPVALVWASQDHVVPRPAFEALCKVSDLEGVIVRGSHSWPMAEPNNFAAKVDQLWREMNGRPEPTPPSVG